MRGKFEDLTGRAFGRLTAINRAPNRTSTNERGCHAYWQVSCECTPERLFPVAASSLLRGLTKSCGCLVRDFAAKKVKDISGKKFGKLTAIEISGRSKAGKLQWKFLCECGEIRHMTSSEVICDKRQSCGCGTSEQIRESKRLRPFEKLYNTVMATSKRFKSPSTLTYEEYLKYTEISECHYCSIGIPWNPFPVGRKKQSLAYFLDRKENNKGYTKDNCVTCCIRCNRGKMHLYSYEEWLVVGKALKDYREKNVRN